MFEISSKINSLILELTNIKNVFNENQGRIDSI